MSVQCIHFIRRLPPLHLSMISYTFFCCFSGTLTIERSQESDIGKYECVAENEVGVAYSFAAMLYVKSK